ncbi:MAG: ATP-binding cassette domain-containing protein [Lachnospiraceae bacterium]|nr:ATP-binding cassette domain-containing protein [Lachnospiraceae bacterium]
MSKVLIEVKDVKKYYPVKNKRTLKALDGVSLDVYDGEVLGVVGESGCGKSTLGKCIMSLAEVTEGSIALDGKDISGLNRKEKKDMRRRMQMVFQNPFSSFNPKFSIGRSLTMVGKFYGMSPEQVRKRLEELLAVISLDKSVLNRMPGELSGGQLQRLAIARALIPNPEFILADEPVSALDVSVQAQILNLILDLRSQYQQTMMFISHDLPVVEHICDRVVVMYLGSIMEMGTVDDLFSHTAHPYTQALLAAKPKENPDIVKEEIRLEGDVPNALNMPTGCKFHTRCPLAKKGLCDIKVPELKEVSAGHTVACHFAE